MTPDELEDIVLLALPADADDYSPSAVLRAMEAVNELVRRAEVASGMVMVSRESAGIISRVFLPANPRKLRPALPEVVAAVDEFRAAMKTAAASLP